MSLWREHADAGPVTSALVRDETWTFLRQRAWHASAVDFLEAVTATERVSIISAPEETDDRALRWLRQHDEREYSYVDATSFVVMRREQDQPRVGVRRRLPGGGICRAATA